MRYRQVHLDFHTSEKLEGIGSPFNKKQFQEALKAGHVNSVTVFAKCHHGWLSNNCGSSHKRPPYGGCFFKSYGQNGRFVI